MCFLKFGLERKNFAKQTESISNVILKLMTMLIDILIMIAHDISRQNYNVFMYVITVSFCFFII